MNVKTKVLAALFGLLVCGGARVWAQDANPGNDVDSLVITVKPNIDYGVDITTEAAAMNLGSVDLEDSTFTVKPATVTIKGTWASQELNLSGVIGGGWDFDITPSTDSSLAEGNALAVYALFSNTSMAANPTGDDFATAPSAALDDDTAGAVFTSERVGGASGDGTRFELDGGHGNYVDMDNKSPESMAYLWFLLRLPSTTTTGDDQTVTVTLSAVVSS